MAAESDSSDDDMFVDLSGAVDNEDDDGSGEELSNDNESSADRAPGNIRHIEMDAPFANLFVRAPPASSDATAAATGASSECQDDTSAAASDKEPVPPPPPCAAGDVDGEDSASRGELKVLVDWIHQRGGYVHPCLRMAPFPDAGVGGCLVGTPKGTGVGAGALLVRVPASCVLFADDASIEGLTGGRGEDGEGGEGGGCGGFAATDLKQMVLALALHAELEKGRGSEFWPYCATLPGSLASFPVTWRPDELQILTHASAAARAQVTGQARALRREHAHLEKCLPAAAAAALSFEQYLRAKLLVCSRCFGIGGRGDVALLPMVDMLNHSSRAPHVKLGRAVGRVATATAAAGEQGGEGDEGADTLPRPPPPPPPVSTLVGGKDGACGEGERGGGGDESGGQGFELRLVRAAAEGEQVYSTYDAQGTRTDASWLVNYGFVPADKEEPEEPEEGRQSFAESEAAAAAAAAAVALRALGPHTHGGVALLEREGRRREGAGKRE